MNGLLAFLSIDEYADFAALSFLALIQGLTEFLPVSSSGHLVLAQSAMDMDEPALAIDIALHLGTLISVLVVYRKAVGKLIVAALRLRFAELMPVVVGTIPAAVIGLIFKDDLERVFHDPDYAAGGLIATSAILVVGEVFRRKGIARSASTASAAEPPPAMKKGPVAGRAITFRIALIIGVAQALAIWPGISRSGTTIACGLVLGLAPRDAARFSFLLSIPTILGAAVLSLPDALAAGDLADQRGLILWAALFAGFVGWGALRVLIAFLGRGAFAWFALYCVLFGSGYLAFA